MTIKKPLQRVAIFGALAALPILSFAQQSVLQTFPLTLESMRQWKLPDRLNEISGLALSPDGRLFAVADEEAAIYELDYDKGRIIKAFAFGKPVQRGDFEGIAILDDKFWLTTSSGEIFSGSEGDDGEQVEFERYRTRLGSSCEIEGLAADQKSQSLILACKKLSKGSDLDGLAIFSWSVLQQKVVAERTVLMPEREIRRRLNTDNFHPSGIAVASGTGHFLIVASRQRALVELTANGELVAAKKLDLVSRHTQPEGIEITEDARLLVSDEGGNHKARLAVYWQEGVQIDHE
jgi:uncharacterized protein YjiK